MSNNGRILLGHGAGGRLMRDLIQGTFLPALDNPYLHDLTDAAVLDAVPPGRPAMTTDGFVVDPIVFPGGDLGHLSVCGTVNDLAVAGAVPLWLTWALILEEGLETELLETLVAGARRAADEAGVQLVAGDTKVVPRGKGDKAYAVTAGFGVVPPHVDVGDQHVVAGDDIVISGSLGDHGATVMACRHDIAGPELRSDSAPVSALVELALGSRAAVRAMHDPTRGGVATTCHEVATRTGLRMELDEAALPIQPEVSAACELLGLDPLYLASEGRVLFWVDAADTERLLDALREHSNGRGATRIGRVTERAAGDSPLIIHTRIGGDRPLDLLSGTDLPRIC